MTRICFALVAALLLPTCLCPVSAQDTPIETKWPQHNAEATAPDAQPEKGPGGKDYAHAKTEVYSAGEGAKRYWVYTPAEPKPEKAPVVAFIHGFGAMEPDGYIEWVTHICRRGNIVVYPQYQKDFAEPTVNYAANCADAILAAFTWLEEDDTRVQPVREKFAIAGHSAGGVTTANMAADWEALKLPKPLAAMPVQPGRFFGYQNDNQSKRGLIPLSEYKNIPQGCLLLSVYGDSDHTVGAWCARKIFADASSVKAADKNLIEFVSSDYGKEPVVAHHRTPAATEGLVDHWDWYGYWKLLDGLTDAAFYGKHREYALGATEKQTSMGSYSDGRPFEPLKVWLGDAKVDPETDYQPAFDRRGKRVPPPPREDPKKEAEGESLPAVPTRKEDE
jgi:hypothetical protein